MQMDTNQGSGSPSQSVLIITTLAAVCAIASSLFFTAGCLCNRYCPKQKQLHESTNIGDQENTQHREMRVAIEQIELTENVAYSQVQIRRN